MKTIVQLALSFFLLSCVFKISTAEAAPVASAVNTSQRVAISDSVYLVQQGDTYYSLSRKLNIPVETLQAWNGTKLLIGQRLYLTDPNQNKPSKSIAKPADASAAPEKEPADAQPATPQAIGSTSASAAPVPKTADFKTKQRILVVPFDPYLYFSDADYEIARQSKIPRQNVRQVFRGRLDALIAPKGYEAIHLLGGVYRDSVSELRTIYKSLHYSYQENKTSAFNKQPVLKEEKSKGMLEWAQRQKGKLGIKKEAGPVPVAQDESKHFGVEVKDSTFFNRFNNQYGIDYYVFINQFEIITNYENCLDRAAMNYGRDFLVHYSIYDSSGKLVSGNKVRVPYQSNMNDIHRIASDNLPGMARRVLSDLPSANNL